MAEAAGCHVNQKASQQNQAQIQDDLRPSADPRSGVSQNYLRRRLPGADVKHVNVAFCVQKEIQKLRNCGQQKEERRRKAEERARRLEEEKKNKGKKKKGEKKPEDDDKIPGAVKEASRVGLRQYARGRAYDPYRYSEDGPTVYPGEEPIFGRKPAAEPEQVTEEETVPAVEAPVEEAPVEETVQPEASSEEETKE